MAKTYPHTLQQDNSSVTELWALVSACFFSEDGTYVTLSIIPHFEVLAPANSVTHFTVLAYTGNTPTVAT